jgi:hypothetical protein
VPEEEHEPLHERHLAQEVTRTERGKEATAGKRVMRRMGRARGRWRRAAMNGRKIQSALTAVISTRNRSNGLSSPKKLKKK